MYGIIVAGDALGQGIHNSPIIFIFSQSIHLLFFGRVHLPLRKKRQKPIMGNEKLNSAIAAGVLTGGRNGCG